MSNIRPRVIVGLAALTLGVVLAACGGADRDDSGEIVEAGSVSAFQLRVGDCFDDDTDLGEEVSSLAAIPCAEPHGSEVYALVDHLGGDEDPYPGEDVISQYSEDVCIPPFASYVGTPYEQSRLFITFLYPTAESWGLDDREIVCIVLDTEKMEGSARGLAE